MALALRTADSIRFTYGMVGMLSGGRTEPGPERAQAKRAHVFQVRLGAAITGAAGSGERSSDFAGRARQAEDGKERTMPVRQRQEVQEMPWSVTGLAAHREDCAFALC